MLPAELLLLPRDQIPPMGPELRAYDDVQAWTTRQALPRCHPMMKVARANSTPPVKMKVAITKT